MTHDAQAAWIRLVAFCLYGPGGILGELIPRMVWNAAMSWCGEVIEFSGFYLDIPNKHQAENGFEIRCTGNST